MPSFDQTWADLTSPARPEELFKGRFLAMALCRRFDDACGPDGWSDEYHEVRTGKGISCNLVLAIPGDGGEIRTVSRQAVAGYADGPPGAVVEEAYDESLRRAAAKIGIHAESYHESARDVQKIVLPDEASVPESVTRGANLNGNGHPAPPPSENGHAAPPPSRPSAPPPSGPSSGPSEGPGAIHDDEGKPIPTGESRRFLGWLSGKEKQYKAPYFKMLGDWGKKEFDESKISAWSESQLRGAAHQVMEWILQSPPVHAPAAEASRPAPPPRNAPPPSRGQAPPPGGTSGPMVPEIDDPHVAKKKQICATARAEYYADHKAPCDDGQLCEYINAKWIRPFGGPEIALPGGIHDFNDPQWIDYVEREVLDAKNRRMAARQGAGA